MTVYVLSHIIVLLYIIVKKFSISFYFCMCSIYISEILNELPRRKRRGINVEQLTLAAARLPLLCKEKG